MTDQSVIFIRDRRTITIMMTNDDGNNIIAIPTEERIKINMEYLTWLYAKSKERKKQSKGLLDTRRAIELLIRDAGGEKALKQLFLKEQDEKIIDEFAKSNPKIQEKFKQDREAGLQALSAFIADLEKNDCLNILQGAKAIDAGMSSTVPAAGNSKRRILVVDDEPDILLTLNAVLSERGHYVKTFDNPVEALSHLTSSNNGFITPFYDLIITDHRMPGSGITGLDFAKRLNEYYRAKGTKTKVFLMSASVNAWSLPEEFIEALKPGIVDEIIQKPISNDKLIAIIEKRSSYDNKNH
jgi:CheY-like chemotaxis protein